MVSFRFEVRHVVCIDEIFVNKSIIFVSFSAMSDCTPLCAKDSIHQILSVVPLTFQVPS